LMYQLVEPRDRLGPLARGSQIGLPVKRTSWQKSHAMQGQLSKKPRTISNQLF
jgi:hypothetical protein